MRHDSPEYFRRNQLLREADALIGGLAGSFASDQDRAAFDAKMAEIEALDEQVARASQEAHNRAIAAGDHGLLPVAAEEDPREDRPAAAPLTRREQIIARAEAANWLPTTIAGRLVSNETAWRSAIRSALPAGLDEAEHHLSEHEQRRAAIDRPDYKAPEGESAIDAMFQEHLRESAEIYEYSQSYEGQVLQRLNEIAEGLRR